MLEARSEARSYVPALAALLACGPALAADLRVLDFDTISRSLVVSDKTVSKRNFFGCRELR